MKLHRIALLILLFILVLFSSWTLIDVSEEVEWNQRKLLWEDFQGEIDVTSSADAAAAVRISAKPFLKNRKVYYNVTAYFLKDKSWCRSKSDHLLRHEQLHFDIAELYARKARKKIAELQKLGVKDITQYNRAIERILQESNAVDRTYDAKTIHGAIAEKQKQWEKNITHQLESLSLYKQR